MIGTPERMTETPDRSGALMDVLSDVLRVAHLNGGVFLHAEFTAPWCMETHVTTELCAPYLGPASHLIPYHYVLEGALHVAVEDGEPRLLRGGELVLFPGNAPHLMGSDLTLPAAQGRDIIVPPEGFGLHTIRHGGGGAGTKMICGYLGSDSIRDNPIISALPAMMTLNVDAVGPAA